MFPLFLTALLMGGLAAWLLYIDFNKAAHRGFALFLLFRAGQILVGVIRAGFGSPTSYSPDAISYLNQIAPYVIIPVVPAIIYFASHYPHRRGPFASRRGTMVLVALTALAEAAYLANHGLFYTITAGAPVSSLTNAGRGFAYTGVGPLFLFNALVLPTTGLLAYLFARDYVAMPQGSRRYSAFLVFAGFTLNALFDGAFQLTSLWSHYQSGVEIPMFPWGWAFLFLPSLTLVPALAAVTVVVRRGLMEREQHADSLSLSFLILCLAPIGTAMWLGLGDYVPGGFLGDDAPTIVLFSVLGLWRLSLPVLVAYSLLRYHLFGIDFRAKRTVQYGSVAGALTLAFFLAGELAEHLIDQQISGGVALFAAAGLAIAFKPLERVGERFAHRLLPGAKHLDHLDEQERVRLFGEQFSLAVQDGQLTAKERAMLLRLQRRLGLLESEAGVMRLRGSRPVRG